MRTPPCSLAAKIRLVMAVSGSAPREIGDPSAPNTFDDFAMLGVISDMGCHERGSEN